MPKKKIMNPWQYKKSRNNIEIIIWLLWYKERTIREYFRKDKKQLSESSHVVDFITKKMAS